MGVEFWNMKAIGKKILYFGDSIEFTQVPSGTTFTPKPMIPLPGDVRSVVNVEQELSQIATLRKR